MKITISEESRKALVEAVSRRIAGKVYESLMKELPESRNIVVDGEHINPHFVCFDYVEALREKMESTELFNIETYWYNVDKKGNYLFHKPTLRYDADGLNPYLVESGKNIKVKIYDIILSKVNGKVKLTDDEIKELFGFSLVNNEVHFNPVKETHHRSIESIEAKAKELGLVKEDDC